MTKKGVQQDKRKTMAGVKPTSTLGTKREWSALVNVIVVMLYLCVEFVPSFGAADTVGTQWLYVAVLNCLATLFILLRRKFVPVGYFKSALLVLYGAFVVVSGLSFFVAFNVVESLVTYSRLLMGFIAFMNLLSLMYGNPKMLRTIFLMVGGIVLYQSVEVLWQFVSNSHHFIKLDDLVLSLTGNSGNKNIQAASIVIKMPFVLYAIYMLKGLGRVVYFVIFFVGSTALFLINARASYISLFLFVVIFVVFVIVFYLKKEKKRGILLAPALVVGMLFGAIFFSLYLFSTKSHMIQGTYGGIFQRVETIDVSDEGSSHRLTLWKNSVDFIKAHPALGGGFGNWKIHAMKYENKRLEGFLISKNVHNDFLEMAADTGILGGMLYAGIFACLLLYIVMGLWSKKMSQEHKVIVVTGMMGLMAYAIDAFLNFPLERTNIQIALAFIIAILAFVYFEMKQEKHGVVVGKSVHQGVLWGFILLSLMNVYVTYNVYTSLVFLDKIDIDKTKGLTYNDRGYTANQVMAGFPAIPNISGVGAKPIACIKAHYLLNEKRYAEALAVLNADKNANPYLYLAEYTRSLIADALQQPDSAYYYAKKAFYNRPANIIYFRHLNDMATKMSDSSEIRKSFGEIAKCKPSATVYSVYAGNLYAVTNSLSEILVVLDTGLRRYPKDTNLVFQFNFYQGVKCFRDKMYQESISYFKESLKHRFDGIALQNIGNAYLNLKSYAEAIPFYTELIEKKSFNNGNAEFYRGFFYFQLGQKDNACADFKSASALGYGVNPAFMVGCK